MSVLLCTPCYGGQLTVGYLRGFVDIMGRCEEADIDVGFLVTEGESLVTRARNNMVATFLNQTEFEHLAFIDADIEMSGADFVTLAKMDGVRGAAVNMKKPGHGECLSCFTGDKQWRRSRMPVKPFKVDNLGAAVMFVSRAALRTLVAAYPGTRYVDPVAGEAHALFDSAIVGDNFLSEDYAFCKLLSECGIPVLCHPDIVVKHYGASVWSA